VVELELGGVISRFALGAAPTIGRGEATIVVASRAISRLHVRLRREKGGAVIEDLATRNGTLIAGARLSGPIPVGAGLRVELGGEIRCELTEEGPGVVVEIAGERYVAPLGELTVGSWRIDHEVAGEDAFVVLRTPPGAPRPFLGGFELAARVELCVGDEIRATRAGEIAIRVVRSGERRIAEEPVGGRR
jgi:hypothetical protein